MSNPKVTIEILDTTLRDGAQALPEANQFAEGSKPDIAEAIAQLGVSTIEAGFPATTRDFEEVQEVARTVGQKEYEVEAWNSSDVTTPSTVSRAVIVAGLTRASVSDIDTCWEAIHKAKRPRIHTFIPTDYQHISAKFPGKTVQEVLKTGEQAVRHARDMVIDHPEATIEFSTEAGSSSDKFVLESAIKGAIQQGVDVINIPDTVGRRSPAFMRQMYSWVIERVMESNPLVSISAHNHNDLGNAVANSFALVEAAVIHAKSHDEDVNIQIEGTICGLGERAGNADIFPIVANIFNFTELNKHVDTSWIFNPGNSVRVANHVMQRAGMNVHPQSPIVGRDTNTHRSGIHSDGVIKGGHRIYTPYDPTFWGHSTDAVHEDGKYQGRSGRALLEEG